MNIDLLDDEVREAILNNLEMDSEDDFEAGCKMIAEMNVTEAFNRYLTWNGIIGYADQLITAYENIKEANDDPTRS